MIIDNTNSNNNNEATTLTATPVIQTKKKKPIVPYKSLIILGSIFLISLIALYFVYLSFPKLEENEKQHIKLPRNIADAKELGKVMRKYKENNYVSVTLAFFTTYIFLQTFAIPGSIFLSILSGFLYPFPIALFFVCTCSSLGATFCYFLSNIVGKRLVKKYFSEKISDWQKQVLAQKDQLLYYIIFLLITPFLPNWFINISSPIINVPIVTFFVGTFLGVAPPSCVYIQAGTTLNKLTSSSAVLSWQSISLLSLFAIISLVPILFKSYLKKKIE